jgi:hypothetical protein
MLKYLPNALVCLRRALEVLLGTDLLAYVLSLNVLVGVVWFICIFAVTNLLGGNRLLGSLVQLLNRLLVESQILLAANEDDGQTLAEVQNLGDPLFAMSAKQRYVRGWCVVPSPVRCQASRVSRWRSKSG